MKRALVTLLLLAATAGWLPAQDFRVPDYRLETAEDYARYEQAVIDCADWLQSTPLGVRPIERQNASKFLLEWITGCPYLQIVVDRAFVPSSDQAPDLLAMFIGGWCRSVLEWRAANGIPNSPVSVSGTSREELKVGSLGGIRALIDLYAKNDTVFPRNETARRLMRMDARGELEDYVASRIEGMKLGLM